jgi:hypothetical protein
MGQEMPIPKYVQHFGIRSLHPPILKPNLLLFIMIVCKPGVLYRQRSITILKHYGNEIICMVMASIRYTIW